MYIAKCNQLRQIRNIPQAPRKIKPEKALQDLPASTKRLAAEDAACRYWKWYVDDEEGMTVTYQAIFWKNPHRVEIIMPNTGGG
ncbi:hypothetical protein NSS70_13085 [Aeribacillus sp. FSL K6-2848]|uniref:hypothetical protein n=1 Tax=unclassified Aeribacillus TaxID=2640495 RepID=UPI0030D013BE